MEYEHVPELAPTQELLDEYKKEGGGWEGYAHKFLALMSSRHIENLDQRSWMRGACSARNKPHHCHRRLSRNICATNGPMWKLCTYRRGRSAGKWRAVRTVTKTLC